MSVAPKQGIVEFGPFIGATPASSGTQGDVPAPVPAESALFLRGDGAWAAGAGGAGGGVAISAGTNSTSTGTVVFSNSNGVSFGMDINGVVTATVVPGAAAGIAALAAGTQTATSGTVVFSNSNGISFGLSGSTRVTASYTVPTLTNSSWTVSDQNTSMTIAQLAFTGSNGLTLSLSTGAGGSATVIGSYTVPNVPAQTNQTEGFYAVGNTTQNSSTTLDARTVSFGGRGIVTVGYSNGTVQISATEVPQTNQTVGLYALGNTTQNSSSTFDARTISLNGLGGITVGYSNGSVQISGPQTVAQTNQTVGLYALGNTTQNSSTTFDARTISFNGLGIVTVGYSNGSVQISATEVAQTNQTLGLYASSNTTAQSSSTTMDARTLSVRGMGVASVGYSAGELIISVPSGGGAGDGVNIIAAGTQTAATTGTVMFSNSNGISFGMSNSSVVTASYTVPTQTNQTVGLYALGNTTQNSSTTLDARTISFNGLGIVTVGYSNGSVQISATEVPQTNQTEGFYAVGNTTQNSSTTLDARTVSFGGRGIVTVGYSNGTIQISATEVPQTNQSAIKGFGVSNTGQTAGNTGISTGIDWVMAGSGSITLSQSTAGGGPNTVWIQHPAWITTATEANNINLLGANTAGNTTASGTTIGLSGVNLTLSGTNNSQIVLSVPATSSIVGTNGISISTAGSTISVMPQWISSYENFDNCGSNTMTLNAASVSHAVAFYVPQPISGSFLRLPVLMTTNSTTIATMASATASASGELYSTWNAVVYSVGVGGNSKSLQSVASGSGGFTFRNSISITNSTQYSITQGFSAQALGAGTTRTTQYSISNTNYSFTTNQIATEWSSGRFLDIPFASSLTPGAYWLVFGYSSSTNSAGAAGLAALTNCNVRYSNHYAVSQVDIPFGIMGSTNLTSGGLLGAGSFSTAGGGTTNSIPMSAISSSASQVRPYFQIMRSA